MAGTRRDGPTRLAITKIKREHLDLNYDVKVSLTIQPPFQIRTVISARLSEYPGICLSFARL